VGFGRREAQHPPQTASSGGESRGIGKDGEKLLSLHTGLLVRMSDSEFDRVWYGRCPDEAAPKPVASGPELVQDGGGSPQRSSVLSE
jgi:hypothetical protein